MRRLVVTVMVMGVMVSGLWVASAWSAQGTAVLTSGGCAGASSIAAGWPGTAQPVWLSDDETEDPNEPTTDPNEPVLSGDE